MSNVTSETTNNAADAPPTQAKLGSKLFKLNPDTFELRQRIRDEAFDFARGLDRSRPLTRRELESHARALVEKLGLPEGYLGFAMVMLGNGFWKEQFVSIPFEKRILLLPHCLKHVESCAAHYDDFGLDCEKCGACAIGDFKKRAEQLGYKILVAEGTPIVLKIIIGGYIDGILGVACLNVLEKAFEKVVASGVPAYAIPLHSSNCKSTTVDNDWVLEVLETYRERPVAQEERPVGDPGIQAGRSHPEGGEDAQKQAGGERQRGAVGLDHGEHPRVECRRVYKEKAKIRGERHDRRDHPVKEPDPERSQRLSRWPDSVSRPAYNIPNRRFVKELAAGFLYLDT